MHLSTVRVLREERCSGAGAGCAEAAFQMGDAGCVSLVCHGPSAVFQVEVAASSCCYFLWGGGSTVHSWKGQAQSLGL